MKKKLIIHGGMHKTGSSAIQYFLEGNKRALLDRGILFPVTGTMHHPGIGRRHFYIRETLFSTHESRYDSLAGLIAEVQKEPWSTIVLSYENFLSPGDLSSEVVELFKRNFEVFVICYFRDPVRYFNAKYKEWVRRLGFQGESGDFVLAQLDYLDWKSLLRPWIDNFGRDNVVCRRFDKQSFDGGRIELDFRQFLEGVAEVNLSDLDVIGRKVNPSFNNDQALASLMRNRHFGGHAGLSEEQRAAYKDYIQWLDSAGGNRGLILTKESARAIRARFYSSRVFMANEMGLEFDTLPLSETLFDSSFLCEEKRSKVKRQLHKALFGRFYPISRAFSQLYRRA